jgi:hypothetical protein
VTVVVKLEPAAARSLRTSGEPAPPLGDVLDRLGVGLAPMHPGVDDDALAAYYTVEGAAGDEEAVARVLHASPGVDGAYVKPPASPP